ncbi:MAG: DUF423 domain-containing protein [Alphaproteobacteria bacterium]|nr:DUF423 domain-containing protein [Alphaproteobacteria bacterium]
MKLSWKIWAVLGALNGFVAVACGAYAEHWLKAAEPVLAEAFKIGVQYQMWHALALLAVAWAAARAEDRGAGNHKGSARLAHLAGASFALGIVLFSGTLYVFGATGEVAVRGAAPAGGVLLLAGWLLLALSPIGGLGRNR